MDSREAIRHLLLQVEGLHERVGQLERGMEIGFVDRMKTMVVGGAKMDQRTVLDLLHGFDTGAVATGEHELKFTLKGRAYTVRLESGHGGATVDGPSGEHCKVSTTAALSAWIKGQRGLDAAATPEGSRLLKYTQAVLAQQGARGGTPGY
jgi:hypothetical protein